VIKKRQPPPPPAPKRVQPKLITSPPTAGRQEGQPDLQLRPIDEEEKLYPFVDMIFGGKLASILVCEGCKHVSVEMNSTNFNLKPTARYLTRTRISTICRYPSSQKRRIAKYVQRMMLRILTHI